MAADPQKDQYRQHSGKGLGPALFKDAILRALEISKSAGVRALIVQAIDGEAVNFYAKCGFQGIPGRHEDHVPAETLIQSFPDPTAA